MLCMRVQAPVRGRCAHSFPLHLQRPAHQVTAVTDGRAGKHIVPGLQLLSVGHEQLLSPYEVELQMARHFEGRSQKLKHFLHVQLGEGGADHVDCGKRGSL